jgi:hypothetical protein
MVDCAVKVCDSPCQKCYGVTVYIFIDFLGGGIKTMVLVGVKQRGRWMGVRFPTNRLDYENPLDY